MSIVPTRLVGREEELALLLRHFESVRNGFGKVILIGGEAGIGKTSLVESLASRTGSEGALVARGYCLAGAPIPYFPFTEALNKLFSSSAQASPTAGSESSQGCMTTGNQDLDWMLGGGIPEGYAVALTSYSCDEKGLLIENFLKSGMEKGEATLFVTIDLGSSKSLAEEHPSNFYLILCNPQADALVVDSTNTFKLRGVENLTDISIALTSALRGLDYKGNAQKRICIDLISDVLLQHHAVQTRRWLTGLITELKSKRFAILATLDPQMHSPEERQAILGLFEGEISIYEKEFGTTVQKCLKIRKMSNRKYMNDEVLLRTFENELFLKKEGALNWLTKREAELGQTALQKGQIFEFVLEKLREMSRRRPLLLILEDLHWADSASLVLLHYLARNTRENKVMIIGTYRLEELAELTEGKPNPLLETMRMMNKEALFQKVELKGIRAEAVMEITTAIIKEPSEQVLELIVKESEGNPLYAVESTAFLISSDALEKKNDEWKLKDPQQRLNMPTTIQDLISRRLSRLDRIEAEVIQCASVMGERFEPDVIAKALKLDLLSVTQKLARISKEMRLIAEDQEGYRFEHARIRDAVYGELGSSLRKVLHRSVAEALLDTAGSIQLLAYHYQAAEERDKTVKFGLMAGDQAKRQHAYSEAATYYSWVIEAAREVESLESKAEALVGRAESLHFEGLNQQAISDSEKALSISRLGSTRLKALRWCAESLFSMGHLTQAMMCVTRAKDESGEEAIERLGLRTIEALFLGYKGDQWASLDILRDVSSCYLRLGMKEEYADCLLEMGSMYLSLQDVLSAMKVARKAEDYVESSKNYGKAVELCAKFGLFDSVIRNESYWAQLNDAAGKYEEALKHLMRALKAAELAEAPYPETGAYSTLVRVCLRLNKVDEAENAFIKMNELYDRHSKDASLGLQGLVGRARAFRMASQGLWKEADEEYSKSIELLHKGPLSVVHETETRLEYAEWLLKQKRMDAARAQPEAAARIYETVGNQLGISRVQQMLRE